MPVIYARDTGPMPSIKQAHRHCPNSKFPFFMGLLSILSCKSVQVHKLGPCLLLCHVNLPDAHAHHILHAKQLSTEEKSWGQRLQITVAQTEMNSWRLFVSFPPLQIDRPFLLDNEQNLVSKFVFNKRDTKCRCIVNLKEQVSSSVWSCWPDTGPSFCTDVFQEAVLHNAFL